MTQKQNKDNLNMKYDYDKLNCEFFMNTMEAGNWDEISLKTITSMSLMINLFVWLTRLFMQAQPL